MTIDFEALAAPFPPERVSWRIGRMARDGNKGIALAYIDARDVMGRLDEVCGPAGWQCRYSHATGKTVCDIGIKVGDDTTVREWIWKADGAGDSDIEAEKGALSDAFKRAAVRWGVGRYLYDIPSPWVEVENKQIVKSEYDKLETLLERVTADYEWGNSEDRATLKVLLNGIRTMLSTADDVRLYRESNAGMIAQLRVKARAKVEETLDHITEASNTKAA